MFFRFMENQPVVLITGCSTGIGYETALLLARKGFQVFATMRDMKKAGPLRRVAQGLPLEILPLDVDKPASVRKAVADVLKKAGRIDALVNNAGWGAFGAIEEFTDAEIAAQFETNVFGLMRVTREVLPAMRSQGKGKIVQIGSLAGRMTFAGIGLYCATKYAVEAITESLRLELKPFGVQAAVVEPGNIRTPFKVNRRKAAVFVKGRSAHQEALEKVLAYGNHFSPSTPGPAKVAEKVLNALSASTMAIRYPAGLDAQWFPVVRWFMPDFLFDFLMKRMYRRFQSKTTHKVMLPAGKAPVALVTGANSGIGLASAKALAEKGYRVYATYRNPRKAGGLWQLSRTLPIFPLILDVNRTPSVQKAVSQILKREGRIDLLVNNAGFVMAGFWEDLSDKDLRDQFETNVFGQIRVSRAVLPGMRERGSGRILNVGSVAGFIATPGLGAYSASKHSLASLTEALRMENRPFGIEVSELAPGEIQTAVVENARLGGKVKSGDSHYAPHTRVFENFQKERFKRAAPVEKLVGVLLKALGDYPLKRRYLVKPDDFLVYYLKWLLPDALWEWGLARMFPWSKSG